MFLIWGPMSGTQDLGVVADLCPRCGIVSRCRVLSETQGMHLFFIPIAANASESLCTCGNCGHLFACESWRYKNILPGSQALGLPLEMLIERTNPALGEKLRWARQREQFGDDPRFEQAFRSLDHLWPGPLKTRLMMDLQAWDKLEEPRRETVARETTESARASAFARSIAPKIPSSAGCAVGISTCLAIWVGLLWIPLFFDGGWVAVGGVALAGLLIGARVYQVVLERQIRRWTHEVLIPEGWATGINFPRLAAMLEDLPPPGPRSRDSLCPLQEHAPTLRKELASLEWKKPSDGLLENF
jgi:hypothetical protein